MMHDALKAVAQVSAERMMGSLLIGLALAGFAWMLLRVSAAGAYKPGYSFLESAPAGGSRRIRNRRPPPAA